MTAPIHENPCAAAIATTMLPLLQLPLPNRVAQTAANHNAARMISPVVISVIDRHDVTLTNHETPLIDRDAILAISPNVILVTVHRVVMQVTNRDETSVIAHLAATVTNPVIFQTVHAEILATSHVMPLTARVATSMTNLSANSVTVRPVAMVKNLQRHTANHATPVIAHVTTSATNPNATLATDLLDTTTLNPPILTASPPHLTADHELRAQTVVQRAALTTNPAK